MEFPRQEYTGVGCHSLLQGIFPTQGSNLGLPHCRQILYHLSHQGSPVMSPGCLVNGPGVIFRPGSDVILALFLVVCRPEYSWGVWGAQSRFVRVWLIRPNQSGASAKFWAWLHPQHAVWSQHFNILAWRIPWTEEPGGLWSIVLQRVEHNKNI